VCPQKRDVSIIFFETDKLESSGLTQDDPDDVDRREFLRSTITSAIALGSTSVLTPREAWSQNRPLQMLKIEEAQLLEAVGEVLVPGARTAGFTHYIDRQVSAPPGNSLLEARIVNIEPPFIEFYRKVVSHLDASSHAMFGQRFSQLTFERQRALVESMRTGKLEGWLGAHGPSAYFILRSDAVDVVYGTMEGYAALEVPYMPHIAPKSSW
jgi:hypothetical protein